MDGDRDVDGSDFLAWQRNAGVTIGALNSSGTATPEPEAAWLMAVGMVWVSFRRMSGSAPQQSAHRARHWSGGQSSKESAQLFIEGHPRV